jgi:adenosylcobinamide-GDP ribazoletransferase
MAGTLYACSLAMPYPIAIILDIVVRMLLTGALHEDGLSDFFDGFGGGGTDRQRILDIMKDSRVGSYGVLSLIVYVLLLYTTLSCMPPFFAALTILAADPYAKMLSAELVMMMPYARTAETAKSHTVYRRMGIREGIGLGLQGLLPMAAYIFYMKELIDWQMLLFIPCLVMYFIYLFIWRRLHGYTGDCCGAMFLMIELSVYITVACSAIPSS